jgi:hypothetical protein
MKQPPVKPESFIYQFVIDLKDGMRVDEIYKECNKILSENNSNPVDVVKMEFGHTRYYDEGTSYTEFCVNLHVKEPQAVFDKKMIQYYEDMSAYNKWCQDNQEEIQEYENLLNEKINLTASLQETKNKLKDIRNKLK